jgi:hypothetical protein
MKRWIFFSLILTVGCSQQPAAPVAEKTAKASEAQYDEVKERKKSIEEAADEAAKLVEADTKAEIEAIQTR